MLLQDPNKDQKRSKTSIEMEIFKISAIVK